jgi:hypothetical protein
MGRANIYLPDDLERRVRAAKLAVSEICQQALLSAVEAADADAFPLGPEVGNCFSAGWSSGGTWAATAAPADLLRLLRDSQLAEIPRDLLPESWFSWNDDQTLAWEAGFVDAARQAVRGSLTAGLSRPTIPSRPSPAGSPTAEPWSEPTSEPDSAPSVDLEKAPLATDEAGTSGGGPSGGGGARLGDSSRSYVGVDRDGNRVAFDPHAALAAGKSPLFAVLGPADVRARLTLSIGQDAAARGAAVVVVDLSGALASRATGLGRNVRLVRPSTPGLPGLEDLMRGGGNLRGVWETVAGLAAGGGLFGGAGFGGGGGGAEDVVKPGYVTVLSPSTDGALSGLLSAASALRTLAGLTAVTDHPRLLLVDLPSGVTVPAAAAALLTRQIRTAREHDVAFGLSAESAETVTGVGGSGALLSTVFGFATTSPVEADRLRDLLGAHAPVLLSPPGSSSRPSDESWAVMRDLEGRLGQVRIDST